MSTKTSALSRKVSLGPLESAVKLLNKGNEAVDIRLAMSGSPILSIARRRAQLTVKPGAMVRIPIMCDLSKQSGWPITLNGKIQAGVQIWNTKSKQRELIDVVGLTATGPVLVSGLSCLVASPMVREKRNSPPTIAVSAVKPGTAASRNVNTVNLSWDIEGATNTLGYMVCPDREVLEPGTAAGAYGWWTGPDDPVVATSSSFEYTPGGSIRWLLEARNADGVTREGEAIYATAHVGYHDVRCPAGGTIDTDEVAEIRGFFDELDDRLRADVLAELPSYVDHWNEFYPDYPFGDFDLGMDYLSGSIGTGSLADDMLAAMRDVLIYVKPATLPRGARQGTTDDPTIGDADVYGKTAYYDHHPDCNWIALSLALGADMLTLCHELYHLTTGRGDSDGAPFAVSMCAAGYTPWD